MLCSVHGATAVVTPHLPAAAPPDEVARAQAQSAATVRALAPEVWAR